MSTNSQTPTNKPVWGLFVAPKIDLNTIGAYQSGWYIHGLEEKTYFPKIIPFTINQWQVIMDNFVEKNRWNAENVEILLSKAWDLGQSTQLGEPPSLRAKKWRDELCSFVDSIENGSYFSFNFNTPILLEESVCIKKLSSKIG